MTATALLSHLTDLGIRLVAEADLLTVRAPKGALTEADLRVIAEHKPQLLALVPRAESQLEALSALRWGPAVADPTPGIDIPRDWRSEVAAWPSERWLRWRSLTEELQAGLEGEPTVEDIRAASRAAFDLLRSDGGPTR